MVFVVIGRRSHDEGSAVAGVLETAAPFLIGVGAAWLIVRGWRWPFAVLTGLVDLADHVARRDDVPQPDLRPRHARPAS